MLLKKKLNQRASDQLYQCLINKKTQMKKLLLILGLGMTLQSCSRFLEETPYDFVSPENLKGSPEGVRKMLTGMYGVFYNAQMFHNNSWILLTCADNDWTNGVDWVMGTHGVGNFTGYPYNNSGNDPYYVFFRMVRVANEILEVLPGVTFSAAETDLKDQFQGEALTMRAFAYFHLVQMFGAVPLHLKPDDPATMKRSSVKEVYEQILNDLHVAEGKLFLNSKNPLSGRIKRGHFRKGAAQLLLAKVYATMGSGSLANEQLTVPVTLHIRPDSVVERTEITVTKNKVAGYDFDPAICYDSAKQIATRLIDTKEYQMETFANTWNPSNFGGKEFIFALETDSIYSSATIAYNQYFTPIGLKGSGWLTYAKDLFYLYDKEDTRGRYGIAHEFKSGNLMQDGIWKREVFPPEDSISYFVKYGINNVVVNKNSNQCFLMKWYTGNAASPNLVLKQSEASNVSVTPTQNLPLLRYTEAYLILAEAENELNGPTAIAYDALDLVRSYRFPKSDPGMSRTYNKQSLRSFILNERTREFIGEGYRRFDLIRWGIYLQVMNKVNVRMPNLNNQNGAISKKREQKHLLYPIPTIEIDGNTDFGPNNPGW